MSKGYDVLRELIHSPCGKRSLVDLGGGMGIRCTWCGVRVTNWDEVVKQEPSPGLPFISPTSGMKVTAPT